MSVPVIDKNVGHSTAYAYAKAKGYTGTEEEFAQLMANYATVGQEAAQSAADAAQSATDAAGSASDAETAKTAAQTAKTGAETAQTGAQTAKTAAETAQGKAETAQGKAETAQAAAESAKTAAAGSASAAATSATNAGNSATAAAGSATAAQTAKTGAETAQAAAETAKTGAETAAASVSASADQIETNKNDITDLKEELHDLNGETIFNDTHSYAGGSENWIMFDMGGYGSSKFAVKLYSNDANVSFEVAVHATSWVVLKTISDSDWHIIDIPANVDNKFVLTYRGDSPVDLSCIVVKVTGECFENDLSKLYESVSSMEDDIDTLEESTADFIITEQIYGNNGETATTFRFDTNFSACPCKKAEKTGLVESLYVKSYAGGTAEFYIGEIDQLYLFVPRTSFTVNLEAGENTYDISQKNIYINKGEQILIKFIGGKTAFSSITGTPEGDKSFYYSESGGMQLKVYGAQKAAVFSFGYTVKASSYIDMQAQVQLDNDDINAIQKDVQVLQSTQNIISDRQGNKYRMIVQDGQIALLSLNFSHVLCVGNSYTTHPTTTDTETDYRNNLWWGHWSMAASSSMTAWTKLLENALKQKNNNAVVTPVFGRRYETNPTTYGLMDSRTFTYWTGSTWASLKDNVANFSDVDAVVFFLGANYSGNDWYTLYSQMVAQFLTWFPNATIFCCSASASYNASKDTAIQQVANENSAPYINMVGVGGKSKIGSYVLGDEGDLHQINNGAVANHFGDYGEYLILDRVCNAMGYSNNVTLRHINISSASGVTLSVVSENTISGSVISVFAEVATGTTLSSIAVTATGGSSITVTDHGTTDYGRVFTFVMPESDVTITATTA